MFAYMIICSLSLVGSFLYYFDVIFCYMDTHTYDITLILRVFNRLTRFLE